MLKKLNYQFVISYLGLIPFLIILLDKFFLKYFDYNIVRDFSILYSIIIFVFIGAINWNLRGNISLIEVFYGFWPSLASVIILIMFLNSYKVINYIVIFYLIQLVFDKYIYKERKNTVYYKLRIPLTIIIIICLKFIQL
tara:strand:+ start:24 stop:440 length:417 start_codon:yes stop_codon:yes gene_type:complete